MALNILTGRSVTITIATVAYTAQVKKAELVPNQQVDQFVSLSATAAKSQPVTWQLNIEGWQEWTTSTGFSRAMNTAAATGTSVAFSLVAGTTGNTVTAAGNIVPMFVSVGGSANEALANSITFQVDGAVTFT
jgi:hypothetical protein